MRVLVTDGDTRPALATVRALGRAGHEVIVAAGQHPSLASSSRFCNAHEVCVSPGHDPDGFILDLVSIIARRQIDVLFPMTEITTLLATGHRAALPTSCSLPFADAATIAAASDKAQVVALARELGIPAPATFVVPSAVATESIPEDLPFPVVVKPARSRIHTGSGWISTGVSYAADRAVLQDCLEQIPAAAFPVLVQERIEGPGRGLFACFDRGRPVAWFAHRRLREKPPSGGVSVLCESTAIDPVALDYANRLLGRLGWHGVAMVEFKEDRRNGSMRLMEINARFWGSLQLAIDAGVDFPCILAELAAGQPPEASPGYRLGVRSRWLAGDLDALIMMLTRSRRLLDLPPSHPGRLAALWSFLHLWGQDLHYEVERCDDPAPSRLEWRRRLFGR